MVMLCWWRNANSCSWWTEDTPKLFCLVFFLGKDLFEIKNIVKFHNFGVDPSPPWKLWNHKKDIILIVCKKKENLSLEKPKILSKKSIFFGELIKFSKYIGQRGSPYPLKEISSAFIIPHLHSSFIHPSSSFIILHHSSFIRNF